MVRSPVKGKIQWAGSRRSLGRYILGTRRSVSLASGRGATMLATLHEFLVEGDALLAHGTLLGRIRREIPAHEAEDLLAGDLGLLRPAPQGADANDMPAPSPSAKEASGVTIVFSMNSLVCWPEGRRMWSLA